MGRRSGRGWWRTSPTNMQSNKKKSEEGGRETERTLTIEREIYRERLSKR